MKKSLKQKIKSYSFWTGLSAAVVVLANSVAQAFGFTINDKVISDIIMSVCGVLIVFGVVCSPIKPPEEQQEEHIEFNTTTESKTETKTETETETKTDTKAKKNTNKSNNK